MSKAKRNALLLLSVAGLLILILAASLPNLVLFPGQGLSLDQVRPVSAPLSGTLPGGTVILWLLRGVIALTILVLPFIIGWSFFTAEGRRRLLIHTALIALLILAANYLREQSERGQQPTQLTNPSLIPTPPGAVAPGAVFPVTPPPEVTLVVVVATWIVVVLLLVAILGFVRRRVRARRLAASPLQELAVEAQTALDAISGGQDLKTTIVTCYREMSRVVREEKDIARGIAMTPREFEDRLVAKGLPGEAVVTLTRLFERVRYGHLPADGEDEKLALACLGDILLACTRVEGAHEA